MQNITNADYIIVIFHTTCWAEGGRAILSQTVCTAPLGLKLITYTLNIWLKGIVWGSLTEVFFLHKQIYTFFYYIKQFHVYVQNIQNNIFSSPETDVNKYSFFSSFDYAWWLFLYLNYLSYCLDSIYWNTIHYFVSQTLSYLSTWVRFWYQ